jgi:holo-[acyl-carrier protein] synthase
MILGIGIDIVNIERFSNWHTYSHQRLLKIFSQEEIDYCLAHNPKSAERFAARFAMKEAFYKAWTSAGQQPIPFLTLCKKVSVVYANLSSPVLKVHEALLNPKTHHNLKYHLSLSHSRDSAIAQVIIETL